MELINCLGTCISSFLKLEKSPLNTYIYYFSNCLILNCTTWETARFQVNACGIFLSSLAMPNIYGVYMTTLGSFADEVYPLYFTKRGSVQVHGLWSGVFG